MRTLLYGGSFDPVTSAHVLCAREAMERGHFDSVIFIPCGDAPHKKNVASFDRRKMMLHLALCHEHDMQTSGIEGEWAKSGRKSYTVDTYKYFVDKGDADYYWLIGSDILPQIEYWYKAKEIKSTVKFCVMERAGYKCAKKSLAADMLYYGINGDYVESPLLEISSTYVRQRVAKGLPISCLVPDGVADFILRNKLYAK